MRIEGEHVFAAAPDIVWPLVHDPAVLARSLPGCNKMERVSSQEYKGAITFGTGPMRGVFNGRIILTDIEAPHRFRLHVDGRGPNGYLRGAGEIALHTNSNQTTTMTYAGDVEVGGRLADASARLLATSARAVVRQCLEGLDAHLAARTQIHTTTIPAQAPATDTHHQPPPYLREAAAGLGVAASVLLLLKWLFDRWTSRFAGKVARQVRAELDS